MSVFAYKTTWFHSPKYHNHNNHHYINFKSYITTIHFLLLICKTTFHTHIHKRNYTLAQTKIAVEWAMTRYSRLLWPTVNLRYWNSIQTDLKGNKFAIIKQNLIKIVISTWNKQFPQFPKFQHSVSYKIKWLALPLNISMVLSSILSPESNYPNLPQCYLPADW
jgi:hypothetical protein